MDFPHLIDTIQGMNAQLQAGAKAAVNRGLTVRNWCIGAYLVEFEQNGEDRAKYGEKLIPEVAKALNIKGLSSSVLWRSISFYNAYPQILATLSREFKETLNIADIGTLQTLSGESENPIHPTASDELPKPLGVPVEQLISELSFSHFVELLKVEDKQARLFYEIEAIKGRWSVRVLKRQIGSLLYERTGLSTNKEALLETIETPAPQDVIRDPYVFEFLGLKAQDVMKEEDLETVLLEHLQGFLLELGHGFCFEERQKKILIGSEHYFVDLVFYHRILKCHVLVELKVEPFSHENAGQLNTYLNWFNEHQREDGDNPPIGILLCTDHNKALAHYALGGMNENLFVSQYRLKLPSRKELETFIDQELRAL